MTALIISEFVGGCTNYNNLEICSEWPLQKCRTILVAILIIWKFAGGCTDNLNQ